VQAGEHLRFAFGPIRQNPAFQLADGLRVPGAPGQPFENFAVEGVDRGAVRGEVAVRGRNRRVSGRGRMSV
jgi:hypothetical protein